MSTAYARFGARNAAIFAQRHSRPSLPPWMQQERAPGAQRMPMEQFGGATLPDRVLALLTHYTTHGMTLPYRYEVAEIIGDAPDAVQHAFERLIAREDIRCRTLLLPGQKMREYVVTVRATGCTGRTKKMPEAIIP